MDDEMEMDVTTEANAAVSNSFVFSKPSAIPDPPRNVNFGVGPAVFDARPVNRRNVFTFAAPTIVSQRYYHDQSYANSPRFGKFSRYKPRISRTAYKPNVNVFASALKDTGAFEQMRKNSRSHATKININNSITCSNVPKTLLTKTAAKEYFMKYGNIVKITIRPRKCTITVVYTSKVEANTAYYGSGEYMGEKFHVEWTKLESPSAKAPAKKKDLRKNMVANLLKATDEEIKSELEAMANLEYNLHSNKGTLPEVPDVNALFPLKVARTSGGKIAAEKAVVVKVEKSDVESQIAKLMPNTSIEELQSLIHQVALTAEDKYKVLEARDRLMRLKRVKPASLATARVTNGTCPDMCPEKERLMRESQRRVAPYEQLEGNEYRINHAIAIKQYSRSSADQEEPMPHELRPVRSLRMTMSYLLHEIVDLCEQEGTNLAEWYHFLWDRTRGIRKDITQQELCCVESVELIEQCARFHIVCSERLCAEDASVFDKKINSENLTKCLQTLKYMYHDLRVKGITCENESEFRAYVILLNLNSGNFLYDLRQLSKSVQNSSQVQFAIDVYFSMDSNNYYKFFKLVRETTYLNACILLRYFNQVRLKALSIMVKAYCRSTWTAFPLYELIDILGFEDENEAKYFCEQVGLNLSNDELHVNLNRRNFSMPAISLQQSRAYNLIESKRIALNFSVGQCIAGGRKMPDKTYRYHKPHNSFDAHGNLMPESIDAADQNLDGSAERYDPYEFDTEKEIRKVPKLTSIRDKGQKATRDAIRPTQIKKQPANESDESNSVASNVFKTTTSDGTDVSVGQRGGKPPKAPSDIKLENKLQLYAQSTSARIKAATDKQSDDKQQPATIFGNNCTSTTSAVFPKQSETTSQRSAAETAATPFAMTVNRSIFSGVGSGNIFMRNIASSSSSSSMIFANNNNNFPVSMSTQQSANDADDAYKMKTKEEKVLEKDNVAPVEISEAEKAKRNELEYARKIQQIEEHSEEIYNILHAEITHEFCSAIAREDVDRIKMYDALSKRILIEMIGDVTREMCGTEINNQQKLEAMLSRVKNRVIVKCFDAWRRYVSRRKLQRKALEDTPVWLQRRSVEENARALYSKEQEMAIRNMRKGARSEPGDVTATTTTTTAENLAPIQVIVYAGIKENLRSLDTAPLPNVFWKLVISWPDLGNRTLLWHHKRTMNEYLYSDDFTMDPIVKIHRPNPYETLRVCIRHFEGFISERNLVGTDALLFVADAAENYKSVAKRLTKTVLSRHKLMPMPLALIVLGDGNLKDDNASIVSDLESLLESGYLSEYTIVYRENPSANVILNLTQSAILWLTMNKSPSNPLEMDYLCNVYDICLSEELWLRILGDSMFNKQLSNALKNPNFVIDLHNEAVNHLIDIILDPESMLYTNFAPELKKFLKSRSAMPCSYEYFDESWKRDEYRARLETAMNNFVLPPWNAPWPITDVQDLRRYIMNYCREVLSDTNCNVVFCDILTNLFLTSGSLRVSNFVQILLYLVKEKVRLLDQDQMVVYNRNHIKHFRTLPWWFKSNVLTGFMSHELNLDRNDTSNEPTRKRKKLDASEDDLVEEFISLTEFCEDTRARVMEVHSVSKEIEERLRAQQSESALLEERLKSALLGER